MGRLTLSSQSWLSCYSINIQPEQWLAPLVGDRLGYRTKARMGVRYVEKNYCLGGLSRALK